MCICLICLRLEYINHIIPAKCTKVSYLLDANVQIEFFYILYKTVSRMQRIS